MGDPRQVTLADVLLGLGKPWHLDEARRALRHPFVWPPGPTLLAAAQRIQTRPDAAKAGEALLVTVSGARASLFRLRPEPSDTPLLAASASRLDRARSLALRDAPWIVPRHTHRPVWGADRVAKRGAGRDETIGGASLDAAFALAALSEQTRVALPSDFCVSAVVRDDGSLGRVDGLELKLGIVADWALGVTRFVVAAEQADEARHLARGLARRIEVVAVANLAQAIAVVCPKLTEPPTLRLEDAVAAAHDAFHLALTSSEILVGWAPFRVACDALTAQLSGDVQRRARFAAAIAARHTNEPRDLEWDDAWLAALPRPVRLRALAHLVQNATDRGVEDRSAGLAESHLAAPSDRTADDLRLLGAIGRALAASGDERALALLEEAIDGWEAIGERHGSSYAFSELCRLVGARGEHDRLSSLEARGARLLDDPRCGPSSRAHATIALGRALVLLARHADAESMLADPSLDRFVEQTRLRWLACALDGLERSSEAASLRNAFDADSDYGVLAQLDAALRDGRDATEHLAKLEALEPELFAQLERWPGATPDAVRRWWRY